MSTRSPFSFRRLRAGFRGIALVESLLMLALMAVASLLVVQVQASRTDQSRDLSVGAHMKVIRDATHLYVERNAAALYAGPPLTTLDAATLRTAGTLPDSFNDRNSWGQGYRIILRWIDANRLDGIVVTTGGTPLPEARGNAAAAYAGVTTGYISVNDPMTARGSGAGWEASLAPFTTGGFAPEGGHIVSFLWYDGNHLITDFIDRTGTPGQSQATSMYTLMDLAANDILRGTRANATATVQHSGTVAPATNCTSAGQTQGQTAINGAMTICSINGGASANAQWNQIATPTTGDCAAGYVYRQVGNVFTCVEP